MITIYHNTRCSKSRSAVHILSERNIPFELRLYMEKPFTRKELADVLHKLSMKPVDLLRKTETIFKELKQSNPTEDEWIDLMIAHPQIIERPIVVADEKAIVARPPERVLDIL